MWIYEENNHLLYFISNNFLYKPNIIITAFNKCLIEDEIKKEKIKVMSLKKNVLQFLKSVDNHSLIIVENTPKIPLTTLKESIGKFFKLIDNENNNIPFMILFSLRNNRFKKPYTHIYEKIQTLYEIHYADFGNTNKQKENHIDKSNSLIIGPNAGRLKTSNYNKDESDCDRAFASNIGITNFRTPEQIFYNDLTQRQWCWYFDKIEGILNKQKNRVESSFDKFFEQGVNYVVFISGPPSSGKTCLGNRVKKELKKYSEYITIIIDINAFNSIKHMLDTFVNSLSTDDKKNIIVIDTLENDNKRSMFFTKLDNTIQCRYIEIDIDRQTCEFLNRFELQLSKKNKELYHSYTYNSYYHYYRSFLYSSKISHPQLKYMKFPLIVYTRKEIFYHF